MGIALSSKRVRRRDAKALPQHTRRRHAITSFRYQHVNLIRCACSFYERIYAEARCFDVAIATGRRDVGQLYDNYNGALSTNRFCIRVCGSARVSADRKAPRHESGVMMQSGDLRMHANFRARHCRIFAMKTRRFRASPTTRLGFAIRQRPAPRCLRSDR